MRLARNVSLGLFSSVISAAVGLAAVPFYLRQLGIEAYGLIGVFATLQALFQVLDFGMAPTINREIARHPDRAVTFQTRCLLHSVAVLYWAFAAGIVVVVGLFASHLAPAWQSAKLSLESITTAMQLMGLVVACRFPISLYQSALAGSQDFLSSTSVSLGLSLIGNVGAILVVTYVSSTIQAFFYWQACVGIMFALLARSLAWRSVGERGTVVFRLALLKPVARFSGGMLALTVAGLIFSQMDRVILGRILPLESFGKYILASTAAGALVLLTAPVYNAIYPRFTQLLGNHDVDAAVRLYGRAMKYMTALLFPLAMVLSLFAEDILRLWTGNGPLASQVAPIMSLLVIGNALHGTMYLPHALQLASGKVRLAVFTNILLMCLIAPLIAFLTVSYGALGGASAWLILHICYVAVSSVLTHRYVIPQVPGVKWVSSNIIVPLLVALFFGAIGYGTLKYAMPHFEIRAALGLFLYCCSVATMVMIAPSLRSALLNLLRVRRPSTRART